MYPGTHLEGFWARRTLVGLGTARSNLGQTSVNPSQTWSTLVKLGQTLGNVSRTFFLGVFDAASPLGSDRLGSGCLVLRADTRENPGGKNGVMTVAPSLFGVPWHKECWTVDTGGKSSIRIFSFSYLFS
jgi:hypothetical protein